MKTTVLCVGKIKEKYLTAAVEEYVKRLSRYTKVEIVEVADESTAEGASKKEEDQVRRTEGCRLLSRIPDGAYVIALAIEGEGMSSVQLAGRLGALTTAGESSLVFIIGGSLGLSPEVLGRADMKLSFSKLTFPHQLMRVILLEQIYRSFRIIRGEPYHK
jgi:23S rRNA (pseudouridine1915-N3)-methyltransferase